MEEVRVRVPDLKECVNVPGYPGVVPGADTRLRVEEVHLALHRRPLLCLDTIREAFTDPRQ